MENKAQNRKIFPALLGNDSIRELVGRDILAGKASHAYIIEGPFGSGKHTAALEIAKAMLCTGGGALPCGKCLSCTKANEGFNSCIHYINSEGKATLSVDCVRRALETVNFLPDDGEKSIYIIEDAERMTPQAQNALLLTLEEPPAHVVFILLTLDASALLETIRSRAHTLKTELFSPSFVLSWLDDNFPGEKNADAASASGGSLGLARIIASSPDDPHIIHRATSGELVHLLACGMSADAIVYLRNLKIDRAGCDIMLTLAMNAVRDMIAAKTSDAELIYYTARDEALRACGSATLPHLASLYRELERARDDICKKNASQLTVFTSLASMKRG